MANARVVIDSTPQGIRIRIRVQPRASTTEIVGRHGDELKIRLAAPPVDGEANDELVRFLARRLGIAKGAVTIVRGATNRSKVVEVSGVRADHAGALLVPDPRAT